MNLLLVHFCCLALALCACCAPVQARHRPDVAACHSSSAMCNAPSAGHTGPSPSVHAPGKPRRSLADSVMAQVLRHAPTFRQAVDEYRAGLYLKGLVHVRKKNFGIRFLPSMFRVRRGVNDYVMETYSDLHFTAPDIYDHRVKAYMGTASEFWEADGRLLEFFRMNVYSPTLLYDKLISPLSPEGRPYYTYRVDSVIMGKGVGQTAYRIRFTPRSESFQLIEGYVVVSAGRWSVRQLVYSGRNELVRYQSTVTMGELGTEQESLPVSYRMKAIFRLLGNEISGEYLAAIDYRSIRLSHATAQRSPSEGGIAPRQKAGLPAAVATDSLPPTAPFVAADATTADTTSLPGLAIAHRSDSLRPAAPRPSRYTANPIAQSTAIGAALFADTASTPPPPPRRRRKSRYDLSDSYTLTTDTFAHRRDTAYFATLRPIPLTDHEQQLYANYFKGLVEKARAKSPGSTVAARPDAADTVPPHTPAPEVRTLPSHTTRPDTTDLGMATPEQLDSLARLIPSVRPARRRLEFFGQIGDALVSRYTLDLNRYGNLRFSPLINPLLLSYSGTNGVSYRMELKYNRLFSGDRLLRVVPQLGYNFREHELYWQVKTDFDYLPRKRTALHLAFGNGNRIYSSDVLNDLDAIPDSLFDLSQIHLDYFHDLFVNLGHSWEIVNGLTLDLSLSVHRRTEVERTRFVLLDATTRADSYTSVYYPGFDASILSRFHHSYYSFAPGIKLTWRPGQYYYMNGQRKVNLHAAYPTLSVAYERGISGILPHSGSYDRWEIDAQHHLAVGLMSQLYLRLGWGRFAHARQTYFVDFANLKRSALPRGWNDDIGGVFQLLGSQWYNSSTRYVRANAVYESPFILLRHLHPYTRYVLQERLYLNALVMPHLNPYVELGYGIGTHVFDFGLFVAFESGQYEEVGVKITFELFNR